jgi:hypothetical protein
MRIRLCAAAALGSTPPGRSTRLPGPANTQHPCTASSARFDAGSRGLICLSARNFGSLLIYTSFLFKIYGMAYVIGKPRIAANASQGA